MYPLKFYPVYKKRIWGGDGLAALLHRQLPPGKIGESWELCCREGGMSRVCNGSFAGSALNELLAVRSRELLGPVARKPAVPLMVKVLAADSPLSVQVHPPCGFPGLKEGEAGKNEAWYVLAAQPGARIVYGLKEGVRQADLKEAVREGALESLLRYVPVRKGDLIHVPSGLVHALNGGVTVYEVQQDSDTTYRVYDYNRHDETGRLRELHLEQALKVIDFSSRPAADFSGRELTERPFQLKVLVVDGVHRDNGKGAYLIYCVTAGQGVLRYEGGEEPLSMGETVLVPAALGPVELGGRLEVLRVQDGFSERNAKG